MISDEFFDVPQTVKKTSLGDVKFPIFYFDTSAIYFYYFIDYDKADESLKDTPLAPHKFFNNKALMGLAFYQYRDCDIGPYNEAGTGILAHKREEKQGSLIWEFLTKRANNRSSAFYVKDLPVTTPKANAAGIEMWGFPKFVTPIHIDFSGHQFMASIKNPSSDEDILQIKADLSGGIPTPAFDLSFFSLKENTLLKSFVETKSTFKTKLGGSTDLSLGAHDHPMAKNLKDWGVDQSKPQFIQYTHRLLVHLHLGQGCS
jgi:hypothetical protein